MKYSALSLAAMLAMTSCGEPPGRWNAEKRAIHPSEVADFRQLYDQNCSGCHGADGQGGSTVGVGDPVYLAIADDATIRRITAEGVPGTAMPPFGPKAGGLLTDRQIEILVHGIRARWAKPAVFEKEKPPAYTASTAGDAARGQNVFTAFCSSCHGHDGRGGRGGSIVDSSYLALVSDQHLRTVTITGTPALGMPSWQGHGKPLSDADVTDVVAWLAVQRIPVSMEPHSRDLSVRGGSH